MVILVIQHNCRPGYKSIVMTLETVLDIRARIILLQKLFIRN